MLLLRASKKCANDNIKQQCVFLFFLFRIWEEERRGKVALCAVHKPPHPFSVSSSSTPYPRLQITHCHLGVVASSFSSFLPASLLDTNYPHQCRIMYGERGEVHGRHGIKDVNYARITEEEEEEVFALLLLPNEIENISCLLLLSTNSLGASQGRGGSSSMKCEEGSRGKQ